MHKGPGFLRVALDAGHILGRGCPQLPRLEPSVRIVAIVALHYSFIDAMMKGTIELLFGFQMATVAELRLLLLHQELAFFGVVRGMAVDAAHIVLQVRGSRKITMFFSVRMAVQATLAGRLRRNGFKSDYLRLVPTAFDMFLAGTMTGLAALPLRPALVLQCGNEVRRTLKVLKDVFVTSFASLGAHVERWVCLASVFSLWRIWFRFAFLRPCDLRRAENHCCTAHDYQKQRQWL